MGSINSKLFNECKIGIIIIRTTLAHSPITSNVIRGLEKANSIKSEKSKLRIEKVGNTNRKYKEASLANSTLKLFLNFLRLCSLAASTVCAIVSKKTMVSKLSCMQ